MMRVESTATAASPEHSASSAIAKGYFKQVRYLLEMGHKPNGRSCDGRTPLILCTLVKDRHWRTGLARTLLEKGAKVGFSDRNGLNALQFAAVYNCEDLIEIFLRAVDFDLNHADKYGNTALFYAVDSGNATIVSALVDALRRYNLSLDRVNREGLTPLMQAWRRDHHECAKLLVDAGACQELKDNVGKMCTEYERESTARLDNQKAENEQRRQRCKIRYDDIDAWRRHQERSRSAPPLRPRHLLGAGQWREDERERRRESAMIRRDETLVIDEASPFDSHNNPEIVFQASPAEFFGRYQRIRKMSVPARSGRPQRPHSAHHTRRVRQPGGTDRCVGAGVTTRSLMEDRPPSSTSWKRSVNGLYHHLQVQCSFSYRRTVKPTGMDGEGQATFGSMGSGGKIGNSPVVSDAASEVTDRSRNSRKSASLASQRAGGKGKGGAFPTAGPGGRSRKISASTRIQSMESLMEDDGGASGSDSVTVRGLKMRSKPPNGAFPPRPVSRAGYANMAVRDSPSP